MSTLSRRWLPVAAWVTVVFTTIPFVRALREWFATRWDPAWIGWIVATAIAGASLITLLVIMRRPRKVSGVNVLWIVAVTMVFVFWALSLRRSPEEGVHLLEYGILAILLFRAFRPSMPNGLVFVAAALATALIGTVDEIIQWVSPSRFWDWRDLLLNGGAGALTQVMLWRVVRPSRQRWDSRSLRTVLRLAAAQLILMSLCLANTPERVARYAPHLPAASHLMGSLNPMAEYGYRHRAPGLGVFTSRLTVAELRIQDTSRAAEVGPILDANRQSYGRFLDTWPVGEDPFTYEARVHLFARDRNFAKAREQGFVGSSAAEQLSTAWYENRLVEMFFGDTLRQSSYRWDPQLRETIAGAHRANPDFHSAVGSHLITFASEGSLLGALLLLAAVMIVVDLRMGRSQP